MFLSLRTEVTEALSSALATLDVPSADLGIEEPPENVDAVLASSAAFRLAPDLEAPPPQIASRLAAAIDPDAYEYISEASAAGPYVNFHPSNAYYEDTLRAANDDEFGRLESTGERVVVEHTSANPTGPVHVGRARNPIIGDALANVLDFAGDDVDRHYYVNDAGRQMAVFTWAYENFDESDLPDPERDKADYDLVRYYRKGNELLEEGDEAEVEAAETEIQSILQGLEEDDEATYERVERVVDTVLAGMGETLSRLPAEFDEFVKETRFMRDGSTDEVAERLREMDESVLEEGAWQLDLSAFGFEKKLVFLRSDGTSLYTTRDLAHHEWKLANYDRAVTVVGEDHKLQADQLDHVLDMLGNDTDRLEHLLYSYVNLPEGKMSTRAGTGIDLDDLLDEAVARAREEVENRLDDRIRDDDLSAADVERIARQVGIGAVRYDIVSKQPAKAITFEWEQALNFEAQSAPYVQYVHARTCGILDEADEIPPNDLDASALSTPEERALLRVVARFPAVVERAADELAPHVVATYTREFAETFNAFYRECPVLSAEGEVREARLALVAASRHTMANALSLLGVAAPESM
ncbi:arginine--tRNA ligase [Halococcus sp. IIIV-5B]|uniref:arginine--tRNA ligase n=1 Tax=Halococcus sp. IIIV-5B TaxID=2321230 RepID=UPI000E70F9BF|nr:arginine--tRNA ligase [Halococcus sp. IIIV-5B]RJS99010.1 arginine--tRNA ligase [Halococcus sp. IIIV-5B]